MKIFKTNNQLSKEASQLYAQHHEITTSIDEKTAKVAGLKEERTKLGQSAIAASANRASKGSFDLELATLEDTIDFEAFGLERDLKKLNNNVDDNLARAAEHLDANPKLVDVAAKEAQKDGVTINRT